MQALPGTVQKAEAAIRKHLERDLQDSIFKQFGVDPQKAKLLPEREAEVSEVVGDVMDTMEPLENLFTEEELEDIISQIDLRVAPQQQPGVDVFDARK